MLSCNGATVIVEQVKFAFCMTGIILRNLLNSFPIGKCLEWKNSGTTNIA